MPAQRQVRYFRGSAAADLLKPLGGVYTLRDFDISSFHSQEINGEPAVWVADLENDQIAQLIEQGGKNRAFRLIGLTSDAQEGVQIDGATARAGVFAFLPRASAPQWLARLLEAAFENIELAESERAARRALARAEREMEEMNRIGVALSSTRDIKALLNLILQKSREVTNADAGSLYLVEEGKGEGERLLRFKLTHNDSVTFPFTEFTMPISENSMAGYVALTGEVIDLEDAYKIPADRPFHFNPQFDQDSNYRTRSMVTLPMKNAKGEILGVLQLINCKRQWNAKLRAPADVEREVTPFSKSDVRQALSLASQAAVAYENSKLYEDIETLFEGFVKAAVTAIEQRDPTTSGHSFRVSTLTTGLAEVVDKTESGAYASARFTREQMKEIRYAALLHDFGKVGVREEVLVKAKKLYPMQLQLVQQRFDYIKKEREAQVGQRKLKSLLEKNREVALAEIGLMDEEHKRQLEEIDDYLQFVLQVNEPTVMAEGKFDRLIEIARRSFLDPRGIERPYLTTDEVRLLSIPKGSLDPEERTQIESHVIHTFNFLSQIPWTSEIRGIPSIARAHHEKLNGSGYPYKMKGEEIPLQSKMMTVSDIFDALSATDRPYKRAVPVQRALEILEYSVRDTEIDAELFKLFVDAKIYQLTVKGRS